MISLPPWLPVDTWAAFIAMRKQIKKPATDFAQLLILKELYKIRDMGHDPVAALEQSIVKCWSDVWPAKDKGITPAVTGEYERTKADMKAADFSARGITKGELAENAKKARERAGLKPVQRTLQ